MPPELFGDVAHPAVKVGTRARYTVPLSIAAHAALVLLLIAIPLIAPDILPSPPAVLAFVAPSATTPPPPPPPPQAPPLASRASAPAVNRSAAPRSAPEQIAPELEIPVAAPPGQGVPGGLPSGLPNSGVGSVLGGLPDAPLPPPPPPPQGPLRVGGDIKAPAKIRNVQPVYPQLAVAARIQGEVEIEATIAADGRVISARVVRSTPLLDQAALDAVRQWRYTPTLLNGVPVPVIMTVTVRFTLGGR